MGGRSCVEEEEDVGDQGPTSQETGRTWFVATLFEEMNQNLRV
jgi:hypothetical protein